jgi:RNA polymerase sigma-70 factor (ECF subfamily)
VASGPPHERRDEFQRIAFPQLHALYNLAMSLTRNRSDAEDLVQETFLRAYRFFESYAPDTHIKAWLFRILRNTFINRYRAQKARPEEVDLERIEAGYEQAIAREFLSEHEVPSPEDVVMANVPDEEVTRALERLPEEYRTVVILALVEDLSYKEIAKALSIPLGTVMSRLHRGRRLLQASLVEYAKGKGILRGAADVPSSKGDHAP